MRFLNHSFSAAALCLLLTGSLALSGCSSSGGRPATSSSSKAPISKSSTPASSSSSDTVTADAIRQVLLTATDISPTAAAKPSTPTDNPLPCATTGSASLEQQIPSDARAGVDISDDTLKAAMSEEIRVYADAPTAGRAVTLAQSGLSCPSGSLIADDGTAVAIMLKAPVDIKADLLQDSAISTAPINSAQLWQASGEGLDILLAVVQLDRSLMLTSFISPTGSDQSKLPSPIAILQKAIEKGQR